MIRSLLTRLVSATDLVLARSETADLLAQTFGISVELVQRSLTGESVPLQDERVRRLYACALELVLPVFGVLDDLERRHVEVARIEQVFSQFLPSVVISDLIRRKSDAALLRGEKRRLVALFSHVWNFAFYVEHNEPAVLVEFLNRHFQLYSDVVRQHGGHINKYIGDAVFALFGAPVSHRDNADRALKAAQEIQERLGELRHPNVVHPPEGYRAGIGLNEGLAIVGNIGSTDSFDYTAIGDTINLAARLESLNKHYHTKILLSEAFSSGLTLAEGDVLRTVDRAKVKGKKTATTFFTVIPAPRTDVEKDFLDAYEKGLIMVKIGNWLTARELFTRALELRPNDELCQIHLERASRYEESPPPDWDGAEELTFK